MPRPTIRRSACSWSWIGSWPRKRPPRSLASSPTLQIKEEKRHAEADHEAEVAARVAGAEAGFAAGGNPRGPEGGGRGRGGPPAQAERGQGRGDEEGAGRVRAEAERLLRLDVRVDEVALGVCTGGTP